MKLKGMAKGETSIKNSLLKKVWGDGVKWSIPEIVWRGGSSVLGTWVR